MVDPEREVHRMHEAIEEWLTGGGDLAPFADALAEDFRIVSPDGTTRDRAAVVASMRDAGGTHAGADPPFVVEVGETEHRESAAGRHLVTYEEHQRVEGVPGSRSDREARRTVTRPDGEWEARTSSAWLREDDDAPGGLAWVHLQETWLD